MRPVLYRTSWETCVHSLPVDPFKKCDWILCNLSRIILGYRGTNNQSFFVVIEPGLVRISPLIGNDYGAVAVAFLEIVVSMPRHPYFDWIFQQVLQVGRKALTRISSIITRIGRSL